MKKTALGIIFSMFFAVFLTFILPITSTQAQLLNDRANMKILRAKSQILRLNKRNAQDATPQNLTQYDALAEHRGKVGCGSVDIGNQTTDKNLSGDIDVIIVGDVINTGNVCKDY